MVLETNSLMFTGDVRAKQNNFAGLGATGGGVPGESFADVSTGVLAQLQHLLAYSGQRVEAPVATRTRENQKDIIDKSLTLRRPVRFSDLTNRWAADRSYARSMNVLASALPRDLLHTGQSAAGPGRNLAQRDQAGRTPRRRPKSPPRSRPRLKRPRWPAISGRPATAAARRC